MYALGVTCNAKAALTRSGPPRTRDLSYAKELLDTYKNGAVDDRELKVAIRALGFDLKNAEVLKKLTVRISRRITVYSTRV
jgi:centrin-3